MILRVDETCSELPLEWFREGVVFSLFFMYPELQPPVYFHDPSRHKKSSIPTGVYFFFSLFFIVYSTFARREGD